MLWSKRARIRRLTRLATFLLLVSSTQWAQTPAPSAPAQSAPTAPAAQPAPAPAAPRPLILIDAAHGGADSGAVLGPALYEKDVTLAIARRLRQDLATRGIICQLVRDSDVGLSDDQRATVANSIAPGLYLVIHASSMGTGLRLFSAMLPVSQDGRGVFVDWQTAQAPSLDRSKTIQQQLIASIQKMGFPVRSLIAPLRPLNNIKVPALAVEVAPTTSDVAQLGTTNYQDMVSAALANAFASLNPPLRQATGSTP